MAIAVADPREGRSRRPPPPTPLPNGPKIFLISCSFSENLAHLYADVPLLREILDPPLNNMAKFISYQTLADILIIFVWHPIVRIVTCVVCISKQRAIPVNVGCKMNAFSGRALI